MKIPVFLTDGFVSISLNAYIVGKETTFAELQQMDAPILRLLSIINRFNENYIKG